MYDANGTVAAGDAAYVALGSASRANQSMYAANGTVAGSGVGASDTYIELADPASEMCLQTFSVPAVTRSQASDAGGVKVTLL